MVNMRDYNSAFEKIFNGTVRIVEEVEEKIVGKHKVQKEDIYDALQDPYWVVMKNKRKSPPPSVGKESKGTVYDIYCETSEGRILFVVGRLFPDGNLYINTAYWASEQQRRIYYNESEVLRNEQTCR